MKDFEDKHADLECPECGELCKPGFEDKDGGVSYRCGMTHLHADFRYLDFVIDVDGELLY